MPPRNSPNPSTTYKLALALLSLGVILVARLAPGQGGHKDAIVVKVYDGDTVELNDGEHVRLIGIDTPELHESQKLFQDAQRTGQDIAVIKAQGERAYEFTRDWVLGQQVHLTFDAQKKDKYGRLLAYVYLPFPRPPLSAGPRSGYITSIDGKKWYFLNATIIQGGYAVPMTIPPNVKYADIFKALYQQARDYKLGLWTDTEVNVQPVQHHRRSRANSRVN